MGVGRTAAALLVVLLMGVATFGVYEAYLAPRQTGTSTTSTATRTCESLPRAPVRSQLTNTTFGAVTEYALPSPGRYPNAVTTAEDGSVWFTEMQVPGVAHLYPNNGTLVEYPWSGFPAPSPPFCSPPVSSWGIALWNGRVWASDLFGNLVVGVSPGSGQTLKYNTTAVAPSPYWLSVGPDGALWFTSQTLPPRLGRISPDMTMTGVALGGLGNETPFQLLFVNSTLAFVVGIDYSENATTRACICTGNVYSFDPQAAGSTVNASVVGGGYPLVLPTSVSYLDGRVWVVQHDASVVSDYDLGTGKWTSYPTSLVPWTSTTLPLAIYATNDGVWFNEHYANKIALLDPGTWTLTEYSEANPPITNGSQIQNDESLAPVPGGLWFTSLSGNYLGFVSAVYRPSFNVTVVGTRTATIAPGGNASFALRVRGALSAPAQVNVSDSENLQAEPRSIQITPSALTIIPGSSPFDLGVLVEAGQALPPGNYTVAVTVTEGGVQQVAYLFVDVK